MSARVCWELTSDDVDDDVNAKLNTVLVLLYPSVKMLHMFEISTKSATRVRYLFWGKHLFNFWSHWWGVYSEAMLTRVNTVLFRRNIISFLIQKILGKP